MIGGKVSEVTISRLGVTVVVINQGDKVTRGLPLNEKTRCIGIDDGIWWQGDKHYWTPQGSGKRNQGKDFDIIIERDEIPA